MPLSPAAIVIAMAAVFAASALLTAIGIRAAPRLGLLAHPDALHKHARPTPLLGGGAIFLAAAPLLLAAALWDRWWSYYCAALAAVLLLGLRKDGNRAVAIPLQLAVQAGAGVALWAGGMGLETGAGTTADAAATALLVAAVVNGVNFLDVQDALAGGALLLTFLGFAAWALLRGSGPDAMVALSLAAAIAGFLLHNRPPARIFMGDSGSFGLGLSAAALALSALRPGGSGQTAAALLLLFLPLAELLGTSLLRIRERRSPFIGEGTHISTALRRRGWPAAKVLVLGCSIAGLGAMASFAVAAGYAIQP